MTSGFEKFISKIQGASKKIGSGGEKDIFSHPHKDNRVVGIYNEEAVDAMTMWSDGNEEIKSIFYLNKVMHMLFPQNTADVHMATTKPFTIEKDKINGQVLTPADRDSEELKSLLTSFKEAGVPVDSSIENFMRNSDGRIIYVDDFHGWSEEYNNKKFRSSVESRLQGEEKERALRFLDRATFFG